MTGNTAARIAGAVIIGALGLLVGAFFAPPASGARVLWGVIGAGIGAILGVLLTPALIWRPYVDLRRRFSQAPAQQLMAGVLGLLIGLIVAALVSVPLSFLPSPFRQMLPLLAAGVFGYLGVLLLLMRHRDLFALFGRPVASSYPIMAAEDEAPEPVLLDTSVIIDGRIADIKAAGFVPGTMLVTNFVLSELQHIADSADTLRRNRGRRGLDILRQLQTDGESPVEIIDLDVDGCTEVDEKLIALAKQLACPIVTNDYNLNQVAELQGVEVLNINELANAVRAAFIPGESLRIKIIQEGKEIGQGVGYLDDGTMVVVEDGFAYIDHDMEVTVTKVLQTSAGRMLFARLSD